MALCLNATALLGLPDVNLSAWFWMDFTLVSANHEFNVLCLMNKVGKSVPSPSFSRLIDVDLRNIHFFIRLLRVSNASSCMATMTASAPNESATIRFELSDCSSMPSGCPSNKTTMPSPLNFR